jgi:hypothetical protein
LLGVGDVGDVVRLGVGVSAIIAATTGATAAFGRPSTDRAAISGSDDPRFMHCSPA